MTYPVQHRCTKLLSRLRIKHDDRVTMHIPANRERLMIAAVLVWLVVWTTASAVGLIWAQDHAGGVVLEPRSVGIAQLGQCDEQWTRVWHCEAQSVRWGEVHGPREPVVHAGMDVSDQQVEVAWQRYLSGSGRSVVAATGEAAPMGNAALFIGLGSAGLTSIGSAFVLWLVSRLSRLNSSA
jgi:hypothetical protein